MIFKLLRFEEARRESNFLGGSGHIRQVFLTQSHVLASKVEEHYWQLLEAAQLGARVRSSNTGSTTEPTERNVAELEPEADGRPDLPSRYSDLKDEHFPLFLTYDQVRFMIQLHTLDMDYRK